MMNQMTTMNTDFNPGDQSLSKEARRMIAMATLLLLLMGISGSMASAAENVRDTEVEDAIEDEYIFDQAVNHQNININSIDGIVTLDGETNNLLEKQRAERIAESVRGVMGVVNEIEVQPNVDLTDKALRTDVIEALAFDPASESYEISVVADDGHVTLNGNVESWVESKSAEKAIKGVAGVRSVTNNIVIDGDETRTDMDIQTEISELLRWSTLIDHELIEVNVEDGEVTLDGSVGSAAEKRKAELSAWVPGVTSVNGEQLEVRRWAEDEDIRDTETPETTDTMIQNAINDALLYDTRVAGFSVITEVEDGHVTLRGTVDNLQAKRAARQTAGNVVGVETVTNRIDVELTEPNLPETEIETDLNDALARSVFVNRYEIDVNAIDNTVYLDGTVDTYYEKGRAENIATKTDGVQTVINNIEVRDDSPLVYDPYFDDYTPYAYSWYNYDPITTFTDDAELADNIEEHMRWSPFVDAGQVKVVMNDGFARLTGTVDSFAEKDAATQEAYEGGAVWVNNDLKVQF